MTHMMISLQAASVRLLGQLLLKSLNPFQSRRNVDGGLAKDSIFVQGQMKLKADFHALKHESRILGHSSNPVCGFSIMEQVRLCAVRPTENWLGSSLNQIQGGTAVRESYHRALEQGPLAQRAKGRRTKRGFGPHGTGAVLR